MKKLLLTSILLLTTLATYAQDTIYHRELRTRVYRHLVIDTMAAKVTTDKMNLDLRGDVRTVTSHMVDYINHSIIEDSHTLDKQGYDIESTRKIGNIDRNVTTPLTKSEIIRGFKIEYTNIIHKTNSYKKGKLYKIVVEDNLLGNYEINYLYDLCGNVTGHDTIYNNIHHTDHMAQYDRFHNPIYVKENSRRTSDNEYTYKYNYSKKVLGQIESMIVECYNLYSKTISLCVTSYTYDQKNRLVKELREIEGDNIEIDYQYDENDNIIRKDTKGTSTKFEEIVERDSYGSCLLKSIQQDGKVVLQIFNDITYNTNSGIA